MIGFAVTLLVIALIAAILGFGGLAGALANVAITIFVIALIVSLILFVLGWRAGRAIVE